MNYNKYIDHTLLKPEATKQQIEKLCTEAKQYDFASVCVNPDYVSLCKELLKGTDVKVCTVIGFPLGSNTTETKVFETRDAIHNGATEIDMVINISWLKQGLLNECINEIKEIKSTCGNHILKVIVETCLLNQQDKINACKCVIDGKANFIKTSTGFSTGGATIEDVKLFKTHVGNKIMIKASGGVKTFEQMKAMIDAGANRVGTSNGATLVSNK
ncbi:MAG: deoxyribose-phosphate aldolase [Mycoplasmataceae bacterium]|nr:deoxyribose-phosphate aldolase [Mycoplasmataceae bacterium]